MYNVNSLVVTIPEMQSNQEIKPSRTMARGLQIEKPKSCKFGKYLLICKKASNPMSSRVINQIIK